MAIDLGALAHKTWRTIASIQTGVVLLILVVILSAAGTIVLQRPATDPDGIRPPTPRTCCACWTRSG